MTRSERFHRARRDPTRVVLEGFHAVKHAFRFGAEIETVVAARSSAWPELARDLAPDLVTEFERIEAIDEREFSTLSPLPHPTGVLGIARRNETSAAAILADRSNRVVFLEEPVHLGNVGACVRVAAAAGAAGLIVSGVHDPWSPDAVRAAAGLQFAMAVARIERLPEIRRPLVALAPDGVALGSCAIPHDAVLAFGSERRGLRAEILERATLRVAIPMRAGVSSLNLATAVAVTLYGA